MWHSFFVIFSFPSFFKKNLFQKQNIFRETSSAGIISLSFSFKKNSKKKEINLGDHIGLALATLALVTFCFYVFTCHFFSKKISKKKKTTWETILGWHLRRWRWSPSAIGYCSAMCSKGCSASSALMVIVNGHYHMIVHGH